MAKGLSQEDAGLYNSGVLVIDPTPPLPPGDNVPDPFGWADQTGWDTEEVTTSEEITPTGFDVTTNISVDIGKYSVAGAIFTDQPGVINPGDHVTLRGESSDQPDTEVIATCTIGGVQGTWSTRTAAGAPPAGAPVATGTFAPPNGVIGSSYGYNSSSLFTGGAPTSYSLNGTLPAGLSFNTSTGEITGTPTTEQTMNNISVTGTNATGSDTTNTASIEIFAAGGWQLPATNYQPRVTDLLAIYPRPDNETSSNARHRLAHSGFEYRIPIGVKSGAYPYKYELTGGSNPAGATIGEVMDIDGEGVQTPGEFYGVIRWNPPGSGTHNFEVTVTDQEGTQVVLTWSVTVNDSKFTFMSNTGTPGGSGTINDPIDDWDTYYKQSESDDTYQGQLLVLRGGNYTLDGNQNTDKAAPNAMVLNSNKGNTIIGVPGEVAVTDCSSSYILVTGDVKSDAFIGGITLDGWNPETLNPRMIHFLSGGRQDRVTCWNISFKNLGLGINNASNHGCIWFEGVSANPANQYQYASQCQFENIDVRKESTNGHLFDVYGCVDLLWERNVGLNSVDALRGLWVKSSRSRNQVRGNIIHTRGTGIYMAQWSTTAAAQPYEWFDCECCYNLLLAPDYSGANTFQAHERERVDKQLHLYRNTFVGGKIKTLFVDYPNYPMQVNSNVIIGDHSSQFSGNPAFWDTTVMEQTIVGLTGNFASGIVDTATGKLAGASRANALGRQGFEISGNP